MPHLEPIPNPLSFGRAVRVERKEQGLSQQELARRCGCSQRFISQLERGKATAELGKALGVLAELGLTLGIERHTPSSAGRRALDRLVNQVSIEYESMAPERARPRRTSLAEYLGEQST